MRTFVVALLGCCLAAPAFAEIRTEEVTYGSDPELHGLLCYDDATADPRPGIVVVHEWWGLNDYAKERTRQLAAAGYVAFAADLYGDGKTTEHPQEAGEWSSGVDLETRRARFQAALGQLRANPLVDGERIAAIGYCFGGGTVLQLAATGLDVRGVASFHGSLPTSAIEPGTVQAKVLICHGELDPFAEPDQLQRCQRAFTDAGADCVAISYGGAKHSFTVKDAARHGIPALEYNEAADRRSWNAMMAFFNEILAP